MFLLLSTADFIFTTIGFMFIEKPNFNPIAMAAWNACGIFGWFIWKFASIMAVGFLCKMYLNAIEKYNINYYWIIMAISWLNLFLIGALLQEWYQLEWITTAPDSISFITRG